MFSPPHKKKIFSLWKNIDVGLFRVDSTNFSPIQFVLLSWFIKIVEVRMKIQATKSEARDTIVDWLQMMEQGRAINSLTCLQFGAQVLQTIPSSSS